MLAVGAAHGNMVFGRYGWERKQVLQLLPLAAAAAARAGAAKLAGGGAGWPPGRGVQQQQQQSLAPLPGGAYSGEGLLPGRGSPERARWGVAAGSPAPPVPADLPPAEQGLPRWLQQWARELAAAAAAAESGAAGDAADAGGPPGMPAVTGRGAGGGAGQGLGAETSQMSMVSSQAMASSASGTKTSPPRVRKVAGFKDPTKPAHAPLWDAVGGLPPLPPIAQVTTHKGVTRMCVEVAPVLVHSLARLMQQQREWGAAGKGSDGHHHQHHHHHHHAQQQPQPPPQLLQGLQQEGSSCSLPLLPPLVPTLKGFAHAMDVRGSYPPAAPIGKPGGQLPAMPLTWPAAGAGEGGAAGGPGVVAPAQSIRGVHHHHHAEGHLGPSVSLPNLHAPPLRQHSLPAAYMVHASMDSWQEGAWASMGMAAGHPHGGLAAQKSAPDVGVPLGGPLGPQPSQRAVGGEPVGGRGVYKGLTARMARASDGMRPPDMPMPVLEGKAVGL